MDKGLFTIERLRCIDEDKADVCEACENAVSDMEKILQIEEELRKINSDNILNLKDLIFFVFKVDAILKEDKR